MMGDPVRAVRLLRGDLLSGIATLSSDAEQALLSRTLAKAACDTVCSEPPDLPLTDAAVLILADDPLQTIGQSCAYSGQ